MKQKYQVDAAVQKRTSVFRKMFFSFVIVPIIPVFALLYLTDKAKNNAESFAEQNLTVAAQSIGVTIDDWIGEHVGISELISSFDEFRALDAERIKPVLEKVEKNAEAIYAARVDNAEGWAIARSDDKSLKNYSERVYFKDPISGQPIGQQVLISKTFDKPVLCFGVPIKNELAIAGVVHQCAELKYISNNVTDLKIGETGFAFLIDKTNKLVASGGDDIDITGQLKDMSGHPSIISGGFNELFTYQYSGGEKVAYKLNVGLDWTLVVQQDYGEVYASPIALTNNAILTVILTSIVCLIIIYLMSRAIAKPIDEARQETTNILESVNDGLLLIDKDYTIGKQQSSSLKDILRKDKLAGSSFVRYLNDALPVSVAEMAKDYIDLLFSPKIKESLVQTRNPLQSVQASLLDDNYQMEARHLNMSFKRIYEDGEITNLLVTAKDITQEVTLKAELEKLKEEKNQQVNLLAEILYIPSEKLTQFLGETLGSLNEINEILEQSGSLAYKQKVSAIYKIIHKVKGDASAIKFNLFASQCHEFEDVLDKLQYQTTDVSGEAFLPVTVSLEELFESHNMVQNMLDKMSLFAEQGLDSGEIKLNQINRYDNTSALSDWVDLMSLAGSLADKYGKHAELHFQGFKLPLPEQYRSTLKSIATQLVRNSLVHGIELPNIREQQSKIKEGQITLSLKHTDHEGYIFTYKDDGEGIDYEALRRKIVEKGLLSESAAERLSERDLVHYLFKDGFSSIGVANVDAGRGVGLSFVAAKVLELKGKMNAASIVGKGFILKIKLPDLVEERQKPAPKPSNIRLVSDAEVVA